MHILFISTTIPYIYIYHVSLCHNCIVVKSSEVPIFLMVQRRIESDSSGEFSWSCRGPWRPRLPGVVREGIGASTSALAPLFWFSHGPISDFGELEELEKLVFWASKRRDCNIQHGENEVLRYQMAWCTVHVWAQGIFWWGKRVHHHSNGFSNPTNHGTWINYQGASTSWQIAHPEAGESLATHNFRYRTASIMLGTLPSMLLPHHQSWRCYLGQETMPI